MNKNFKSKDFIIARKNGKSFSYLCKKYSLTEEELENAIRKVISRGSDEFITAFKENDKRAEKQLARKAKQLTKEENMSKKKNLHQAQPSVPVFTVKTEQTKLEMLLEQKASILDELSNLEKELSKFNGIRDEVKQKVTNLTAEVRELQTQIETKITEVNQLNTYSDEIDDAIAVNLEKTAQCNANLEDILHDIEYEQKVVILVMQTGVIKIDSLEAFYPEISASELVELASMPFFENLTLKHLKQLMQLRQIEKDIAKEHHNIEINFEDETLKYTWEEWKNK